jgi:glutamyl-tRNA synthetase
LSIEEIKDSVLKYSVHNAVLHQGKAQPGPVIGRIMSQFPSMRNRPKEVSKLVHEIISEVNSWPHERQSSVLNKRWPELLEVRKKTDEKKTLPPLENVEKYEIVKTRFAPNPDGALHLGSAEPIIFCDEYAKMYNGKFILRYEDTSPDVKTPIPEMYDWIKEDLEWLGVNINETYIQSDRLEIYYKYAVKLFEMGHAYVCTCLSQDFKKMYMAKEACPCRPIPAKSNLERWKKMLDGSFKKGDAVVRIKTDLNHPNPAVRDWPALRIAEGIHPRQGDKYRVWPLYNFSCAIDDHEMNVSHIIRGKEHEVNTTRQRYLSNHFGWEFPEIINIGRLGLEVGVLSKSRIRQGIEDGTYTGWDDPRLGTLRSLKKRGLQPGTIREIMIQVGPKPINATLSWDHIASVNRKLIEPISRRFTFVKEPYKLNVTGLEGNYIAKLPRHPDHPEWGTRDHLVNVIEGKSNLQISKDDVKKLNPSSIVRLMGLFNIEISEITPNLVMSRFHSKNYQEARKRDAPFIHWLPDGDSIETQVIMPDSKIVNGISEIECRNLEKDSMIQFERFGFVRVESITPFVSYYTHR